VKKPLPRPLRARGEAVRGELVRAHRERHRALDGHQFPEEERRTIVHGADEIDLVNSGLEETMIGAYHQIRETQKADRRVVDLRTAALRLRRAQVATSYLELGVFLELAGSRASARRSGASNVALCQVSH